MAAISIAGVALDYPGTPPLRALHDCSFEVSNGEFTAVLGPSGCGKSSLLHLLAGFEFPTTGSVTVAGAAVQKPSPERGVVFQEAALFPWLSVWDNVLFGPRVLGRPAADTAARAREMLALTGLSDFAHHLPAQLSGGIRQRVALARVLTLGSAVLLMDEPFGALDAQTRLDMQELLLDLWQRLRPTVVFVTHDIDEAILLTDTIHVMSARPGQIIRRIEVPLDRPRGLADTTSAAFNGLKSDILRLLRPAHLERTEASRL